MLPEHMRPTQSSRMKTYAAAVRAVRIRREPITAHETKRNHRPRFDERWTAGAIKRIT